MALPPRGESCYGEKKFCEEVHGQEVCKEIRPRGRRQEGDAQRRCEEDLREEDLCQKDGGEEIRRQKGVAKKSAAKRAPAKRKKVSPMPTPGSASRPPGPPDVD
jgi:hypothetical protein